MQNNYHVLYLPTAAGPRTFVHVSPVSAIVDLSETTKYLIETDGDAFVLQGDGHAFVAQAFPTVLDAVKAIMDMHESN